MQYFDFTSFCFSIIFISATTSQGILQAHQQQQQHQQAPPGTITVSVADIKSIPQAIIAQCSNAWSPNNSAVALTSSDLNNYQTIKWENATPIQAVVATKATTLNTAGLHFISAPAAAAAQTVTVAPSNHVIISHNFRFTIVIAEYKKCKLILK